MLFAFLTARLFGRELADRTVRALLAISTPRSAIVAAKTIVTATWCLGIAAWVLVFGLASERRPAFPAGLRTAPSLLSARSRPWPS